MSKKILRREFVAALSLVLVFFVVLTTTTYAWFVSNTTVTAGPLVATAQSSELLRIATDNSEYTTVVNLDSHLTNFLPVSAGEDLVKTGVFYKVSAWADEVGVTSDAGKVATQFVTATAGTDYAVANLWFTDNLASNVYFTGNTIVTAHTMVKSTDGTADVDVYAQFKAGSGITTYTVASGTAITYADTGLINNGVTTWDADTNIIGAKAKLQNALGAIRITFVPYATAIAEDSTNNASDTTANATLSPVFYTLSATTAGYYNTDAGSGVNITTDKRIDSVVSSAAILEDDDVVLLSNTTQICNLPNPNSAQHFKVYYYLEGCDKQCITGISDNITYTVNLAFSTLSGQ